MPKLSDVGVCDTTNDDDDDDDDAVIVRYSVVTRRQLAISRYDDTNKKVENECGDRRSPSDLFFLLLVYFIECVAVVLRKSVIVN